MTDKFELKNVKKDKKKNGKNNTKNNYRKKFLIMDELNLLKNMKRKKKWENL